MSSLQDFCESTCCIAPSSRKNCSTPALAMHRCRQPGAGAVRRPAGFCQLPACWSLPMLCKWHSYSALQQCLECLFSLLSSKCSYSAFSAFDLLSRESKSTNASAFWWSFHLNCQKLRCTTSRNNVNGVLQKKTEFIFSHLPQWNLISNAVESSQALVRGKCWYSPRGSPSNFRKLLIKGTLKPLLWQLKCPC